MKIKEKGLTGKAADLRRQSMGGAGRKGFNAFREMAGQKGDKGKKKARAESIDQDADDSPPPQRRKSARRG